MDLIRFALTQSRIEYAQNFDVIEISTIKFSQLIDLAIFPKNTKEFVSVLKILNKNKCVFRVVGNTSNLLFTTRINYPIVFTNKMKDEYIEQTKQLYDNL